MLPMATSMDPLIYNLLERPANADRSFMFTVFVDV
jgi:hypothetical protein